MFIWTRLAPKGMMKERRMRSRYSVTYESDTRPVETDRGEFEVQTFSGHCYSGRKL